VEKIAEELAILEVEMVSPTQSFEEDKDLIKFFVQCFDRPAFQDDIRACLKKGGDCAKATK